MNRNNRRYRLQAPGRLALAMALIMSGMLWLPAGTAVAQEGEPGARVLPSELIDRTIRRTDPGGELVQGELTYLQVLTMEHQLAEVIGRALDNFFEPERYLLHVGIEVSTRALAAETQVPVALTGQAPSEQLPGMPFIPPELRRMTGDLVLGSEQMVQTSRQQVPELDRFEILIWADTLFSDDELALMRQVVEAKVSLLPERGDRLEIIRQTFRRTGAGSLVRVAPGAGEALADFPATSAPVSPWQTAFDGSLSPDLYIMFSALVLFLLFLILLAWYLVASMRLRRAAAAQAAGAASGASGSASLNMQVGSMTMPEGSSQGGKLLVETTNANAGGPQSVPKDFLMQTVLQHPEQIGRLFTYWYENEGEHALVQIAGIVQSLDPKLLGMLKKTMDEDLYFMLESQMNEPLIQSQEKKDELLRKFAWQLKMRKEQSSGTEELQVLPTFDFLHYTDNEMLLELLRDESERVKALVLSHLPADRRGWLLREFGVQQAAGILFSLSQVRRMPYQEYQRIASYLFDRSYYGVLEADSTSERDVQQIVAVIESLPVSDQERYIRQLGDSVSDLGDAVRERVITMERVPTLDEEMLSEAVQAMTRDDLAAMLVGADQELCALLLRFRPEREERVIRDEIENLYFMTRKDIDSARAVFLGKLRAIRQKREAGRGKGVMSRTEETQEQA